MVGLQVWHLSQTGTQLPAGIVPPPPHQTGRGRCGGDVTDHSTRRGMGTTTRDLSPPLPSPPLPAQHTEHGLGGKNIRENRTRWHLGDREEKPVGFLMSDGHAGDREGTAKRELKEGVAEKNGGSAC